MALPKIGELNRQITLHVTPGAVTQDSLGAAVRAPAPAELVWAKVQDLRGRDIIAQAQSNTVVERMVWISWRPDVTTASQFTIDGRLHVLVGAPISLRNRTFLELMLASGPAEVGVGVQP